MKQQQTIEFDCGQEHFRCFFLEKEAETKKSMAHTPVTKLDAKERGIQRGKATTTTRW